MWETYTYDLQHVNEILREKGPPVRNTKADAPLLADIAYEKIRDRIITLDLPPGAALSEEALMPESGAGRTPVRQALRRLEGEHLVVIHPRRGTFVAPINIRDEAWLAELRMPLEGVAAWLAAHRATPEERTEMTALAETPLTGSTPQELLSVDAEAHRLIYRAAHNPHLEATLGVHFNLGLRIWHATLDVIDDLKKHVVDEIEVLRLVIAGESDAARAKAEEHLLPQNMTGSWPLHRLR